LAERFRNAGVTISLQPLELSDPVVDAIGMLLLNVQIFFRNLAIDLARAAKALFSSTKPSGGQSSGAGILLQSYPATATATTTPPDNVRNDFWLLCINDAIGSLLEMTWTSL
jgi:hypothetical protein